jgi:hypothetical protein
VFLSPLERALNGAPGLMLPQHLAFGLSFVTLTSTTPPTRHRARFSRALPSAPEAELPEGEAGAEAWA